MTTETSRNMRGKGKGKIHITLV